MGVAYSQCRPPAPTLTEANVPSQAGKVFIVTGGASGVGRELCKILYGAGGKVYIAGRSEANANAAITSIKAEVKPSTGELKFLSISLDDLSTIKPAVEAFTSSETRLDVLFNNAGLSSPPSGSVSAQNHELQMATNCLGPYLLTQLLLPVLTRTAKSAAPAAVRVVWTSSLMVDLAARKGGNDIQTPLPRNIANYTTSKTGNWFLASALNEQPEAKGVLSVTQNPGNLQTAVLRHFPSLVQYLASFIVFEAKFGAYTELWAGLSPELGEADGGAYVVPWGRLHPSPRQDLLQALKSKEKGGTGQATSFTLWCEKQTERFR